ncbi:MAG: prealbumin-like fold domain-containing protein, partial [Paraclostridium sp.]|uniref:prealbumin-like fold domain-containing protein n=1 Tax=Paraclostridium sp. TaxID=2023273 RepID=UPI003F2C9A83
DKNGKVEFGNLAYGNYYYQETKAPEGYTIDNKMYPFEVKTNNQVISLVITNEKVNFEGKIVNDPTSEEKYKSKSEDPRDIGKVDQPQKSKTSGDIGKSEKTVNNKENESVNKYQNGNPITSDSSMLPYIGLFTASTIGLVVSLNNKKRK